MRFEWLDLLSDPVLAGPFDLVVSTNVFEHLPNVENVVDKTREVLCRDGTAVLIFGVDSERLEQWPRAALYRLFSARFLPWEQVRYLPCVVTAERFTARVGGVTALVILSAPTIDWRLPHR